MHAYALFMEIWIRIETRHLDRAAVLAASLSELAEHHDLDFVADVGGPPNSHRSRTRSQRSTPTRTSAG